MNTKSVFFSTTSIWNISFYEEFCEISYTT